MSDYYGAMLPTRMAKRAPPPLSTRSPDPTFLESVAASFRTTTDEQDLVQIDRLASAYSEIEDTLADLGVDRKALYRRSATPGAVAAAGMGAAPGTVTTLDRDAIWREIARLRARDPKLFAGLPGTRAEFEQQALTRNGVRARDQDVLARTDGVSVFGMKVSAPALVGGAVGSFADPVNVLTAPIGFGAKTIGQAIIAEAIVNATVEALQTPNFIENRANLGETTTAREVVGNIAIAGVAGGALGGAGKAIEIGAPKDVRGRVAGAVEGAIERNWDRLPEAVRSRWARAADVPESDLPELAEMVIGRENMSADERAAAALLTRDAEVAAINPFKPTGAGVAAHQERLGEALSRILADRPQPRAAALPTRPNVALRGSTGLASGSVPDLPARSALKARIGQVESGGSNVAANPRSSARGKYQFIDSTWLTYYKRRFGAGESDAAILAKRSDGALQDVLMDDLIADNAAFLKSAGEIETPGNLYLVHFAGQGGARKLFDADPSARAVDVLGEGVVRANPWMEGMTAGDVIAWAHRKMGGAVPPRAGARVELADSEAPFREQLQAELDQLAVERAAIEAEASAQAIDPAEAAARAVEDVTADADPVIVDTPDMAPVVQAGAPQPIRPRDDRPVDVIRFLAQRGGIRDDEGHSLTRSGRNSRTGRQVTSSRDYGRVFVPRVGPLVRLKNGMSIDRAGELLWEAGYFAERPTPADVLEVLDRAVGGEKIYALGAQGASVAREVDPAYEARLQEVADLIETDLGAERGLVEDVAARMDDGEGHWDALEAALYERGAWLLRRANAQVPEDYADGFDIPGFDDTPPIAGNADPFAAGGGRPAAGPGASSRGGEPGRDVGTGDAAPSGLTPDFAARGFAEPEGPSATAQANSIDHDLRLAIEAGDIDPTVRLDEDGGDVTIGDLIADLDDEASAIDTVKKCL